MNLKRLVPVAIQILERFSPSMAAAFAIELFFRPARGKRSEAEAEFWSRGEEIVFQSGCRGRKFGSSGPSIWFVHGWESRGSHFRTLIEDCVREGYQVIAWEGPAHGDNPGRKTNLAEFGSALKTDIEKKYGQVLAVIGHSFGGGASAYACRLGLKAELLVLIGTPATVQGVFERFWQWVRLGPKAYEHFVRKVMEYAQVPVEAVSLSSFISELPQRLLIVHDEDDRDIPFSEANDLKALRPDAEFLKTTGFGHRRLLKSSIVSESIIQFLNSAGGRRNEHI